MTTPIQARPGRDSRTQGRMWMNVLPDGTINRAENRMKPIFKRVHPWRKSWLCHQWHMANITALYQGTLPTVTCNVCGVALWGEFTKVDFQLVFFQVQASPWQKKSVFSRKGRLVFPPIAWHSLKWFGGFSHKTFSARNRCFHFTWGKICPLRRAPRGTGGQQATLSTSYHRPFLLNKGF